jgi:hypothetical protein
MDTHHLWYPSNDYDDTLSAIFRNLPENKVEICRAAHEELHATQEEPVKPSREQMSHAIETAVQIGSISLTKRKRKALWKAA